MNISHRFAKPVSEATRSSASIPSVNDPLMARFQRTRALIRTFQFDPCAQPTRSSADILVQLEKRIEALARNRTEPDGEHDQRSGLELMAARAMEFTRRLSTDRGAAERATEGVEAAYLLGMIAMVEELQDLLTN